MNTPIYDFVSAYSKSDFTRFHMPGHKGKGFLCEPLDITEINGADSLFEASGIISESEKNASLLFNTQKTLYSTQGSTLCIQTMLALVTMGKHKKEKPLIVAVRNAHTAFLNSCILLDVDVKWVYPKYSQGSIASGEYDEKDIEKAICECDRKPCAVYVTSPDYLGNIADIKAISKVCKKREIPLLVDNAHGAYLNFLDKNIHPINLGADMCCDSAHKTLPSLTSCGYLHISKNAPKEFSDNAKSTMEMFASTSPSYLSLCSLDLCNKYLYNNVKTDIEKIIPNIENLKNKLSQLGYTICGQEPLKLTVYTIPSGMYGYELAQIMRDNKIECEYADKTHIVFMFSPKSTACEVEKLYSIFKQVKQPQTRIEPPIFTFDKLDVAMSMREAALSESVEIPTEKAQGRICSRVKITCPPGIPVCVSGEVISANTVLILKKCGINSVNVIKC